MLATNTHIFWSPGYAMMLLIGFGLAAVLWSRRTKGQPEMVVVLAGGLVGLIVGGKLGYLFAEGHIIWHDLFWQHLLVGKTVVGALIGGYAGVELGKKLIGYRQATGDTFALAVPAGLILGRVGCLMHGCCKGVACNPAWWTLTDPLGVSYYPAAVTEIVFNVIALITFSVMSRKRKQTGQLFHLYLIAYGLFRFGHEFVRDTPTLVKGSTGYQILALAMVVLGFIRYIQRRNPKDPIPDARMPVA